MLLASPERGRPRRLQELIHAWKDMGPDNNIVCGARAHAAARLMHARRQTSEHGHRANKIKCPAKAECFIDDISMARLSLLNALAPFVHLGASLAAVGDFNGQELPSSMAVSASGLWTRTWCGR